MTLASFEELVLSQQPPQAPWTPVTDYSLEARRGIEGVHPQIIKDVFEPQYVIDAGCGPDAILVRLLDELGVKIVGFDPQIPPNSINPNLFHGDLCDPALLSPRERPLADLVICREVLEHLTICQIRQAVTNLCRMTRRYVYVTTRFAKDPQSLLDVDTSDDLDPTHISLLNQDFLRVLFVLEGFRRCPALEERMDHQKKGRVLVYERA